RKIENDILRLDRRKPTEEVVARVAAAIGLLLQLRSWSSFRQDADFFPRLRAILARQQPAFEDLPAAAVRTLERISEAQGNELVARPGQLSAQLRRALFPANKDFPMQRTISRRDPPLFEHPESARYVQ